MRQSVAMFSALMAQPAMRGQAQMGMAQACLMTGQVDQAMQWARQAAQDESVLVPATVLLSRALRQKGLADQAQACCEAALQRAPASVELMSALALAQRASGKQDQAQATYQHAITLAPGDHSLHHNLGNILQVKGDLAGAQACYRQALALQPGHALALFELANLARRQGALFEACQGYRLALKSDPKFAAAWRALAQCEAQSGDADQAIHAYAQLMALQADDAASCFALAQLAAQRDPQMAIDALEKGLKLQPGQVDGWLQLAKLAFDDGRYARSMQAATQAVALAPEHAGAHLQLACACHELGLHEQTLEAARRALLCMPDEGQRMGATRLLAQACLQSGDLDAALTHAGQLRESARGGEDLADADALLAGVARAAGCSERALDHWLSSFHHAPSLGRARAAMCAWQQGHSRPDVQQVPPQVALHVQAAMRPWRAAAYFGNARLPGKVLRVGYLSGGFDEWGMAACLAPLWRSHDPARVQVWAYSSGGAGKGWADKLKPLCHAWRDVGHMDARRLRQQIREDGIDVLVDLTGWGQGSRLEDLAHRVAPVQCAWLGGIGASELGAVDYCVTDAWACPPPKGAPNEAPMLALDRVAFCYEAAATSPAVAPLPWASQTGPTFGSLGALQDVGDEAVAMWGAVLRALPAARLMVQDSALQSSHAREGLLSRLAQQGVAPDRIKLVGPVANDSQRLALYSQVDVLLDSFAGNDAARTCEALWMGVPVVSCWASSAASRCSLAILAAMGLSHLAVSDQAPFVQASLGLVDNVQALSELRFGLRGRMQTSAVMDARGLAGALEAGYRAAWLRWCNGQSALSAQVGSLLA